MQLKFAPFWSPLDMLLHGITLHRSQKFQFVAENHGLLSGFFFFVAFLSSPEDAMKYGNYEARIELCVRCLV